MKRTSLQRKTPMRRTGFAKPPRTERERTLSRLYRVPAPFLLAFTPAPKAPEPVRSRPYRMAVAALPCWLCRIEKYSQAAHGDFGKGCRLKSCDLTCYPACGPHDGVPGCHYLIGTTGTFTREERRAMESQAAEETRTTLIADSVGNPKLRAVLVSVGLVT